MIIKYMWKPKIASNMAMIRFSLWSWFTPKLIWDKGKDKGHYDWNIFYRLKPSFMFQWALDLLWKYATHKVVIGFMWVISFAVDIIKLHFGWHYLNKMKWTVVLFANFQPVCFTSNSLNKLKVTMHWLLNIPNETNQKVY